jgi:hypothetical protein
MGGNVNWSPSEEVVNAIEGQEKATRRGPSVTSDPVLLPTFVGGARALSHRAKIPCLIPCFAPENREKSSKPMHL